MSQHQLYLEKHNTIDQAFPLMFRVLKIYKRAGKVVVQDKHGSVKKETISCEDFYARFTPAV